MYECFHCGQRTVSWDSDFSFEDYRIEGEGIVQVLHCNHCGAEIHYIIRLDEDDIEEILNKNTEEVSVDESSCEV